MDCWICGAPATTGEHLIKRSDLRALFGRSDSKNPLRRHDKSAINQVVQSEGSKQLMSTERLCAKCNAEATQPYDRAWETLSKYLRTNWKAICRARHFDFDKAFPARAANEGALRVHLYFVKLFGCRLAEENPNDLDLTRFALALRHGIPHPFVYLQFGDAVSHRLVPTASITAIEGMIDRSSGRLQGAMWYYTIGQFTVRIGYLVPGFRVWPKAWHPSHGSQRVRVRRYLERP